VCAGEKPGLVFSTRSEIESHRPLARNKSSLGSLARPTSRRNAYPIPFAAISLHLKRSAAGVSGRTKREKRAGEALPQEQQTANTNTTTPARAATEQKPPASQSTRQLIDSDNWTEVSVCVCCESAIFLLPGSKDRVRARECALLQAEAGWLNTVTSMPGIFLGAVTSPPELHSPLARSLAVCVGRRRIPAPVPPFAMPASDKFPRRRPSVFVCPRSFAGSVLVAANFHTRSRTQSGVA